MHKPCWVAPSWSTHKQAAQSPASGDRIQGKLLKKKEIKDCITMQKGGYRRQKYRNSKATRQDTI